MELEFMDMGYQTGSLGLRPANVQPFNELTSIYVYLKLTNFHKGSVWRA